MHRNPKPSSNPERGGCQRKIARDDAVRTKRLCRTPDCPYPHRIEKEREIEDPVQARRPEMWQSDHRHPLFAFAPRLAQAVSRNQVHGVTSPSKTASLFGHARRATWPVAVVDEEDSHRKAWCRSVVSSS